MHNQKFYRPSIIHPAWVPSPSQLRKLDQDTSESVNGDEGGVWAPSSQIIIGGLGVRIAAGGGFTGGVKTGKKAPAGALSLGDSDFPVFSTPRTRQIVYPIRETLYGFADENTAYTGTVPSAMYRQDVPGRFQNLSDGTVTLLALIPISTRYLPVGVTVDEVTLRFSVGEKPTALPGTQPQLGWGAGATFEYASLAAADVDAYYNGGLPQSIALVPATNTPIAASTDYQILITDQTLTKNIFHSVIVSISNIVDMRPGL